MQIMGNVVPYIDGRSKNLNRTTQNSWFGRNGWYKNSISKISAHCNRVPTLDGHMACVSLSFKMKSPLFLKSGCWQKAPLLDLPLAPKKPLVIHTDSNRPQVLLDRDNQSGMSVHVGRLRACPVHHIRFVGLSHNTLRGAAGGGLLIAELLVKTNLI